MIPKKIRRTITVDNVEYEYCVTGCVNIYIKNLKTKEEIKWGDDWKPKWKMPVTPKMIKEIIQKGEFYGILVE